MSTIKDIKNRFSSLPEKCWKKIGGHIFSIQDEDEKTAVCQTAGFFNEEENSVFIEHAPKDMAYLLSYIDHLEKQQAFKAKKEEALELILYVARHTPWENLYGTGLLKAIEQYDKENKRVGFDTRAFLAPSEL